MRFRAFLPIAVCLAVGQLFAEPTVAFAFPDAMRVWTLPGAPLVPVRVAIPPEAERAWVRLTVSDWQGEMVQEVVRPVRGTVQTTFALRPLQAGWYAVRATLGQGEASLAEAGTSIALLSPLPRRVVAADALDCTFGVCVHLGRDHYDHPETYQLLKLCGMRWVRDDLSWGAVEHEAAGQYEIPAAVRERGAKLRREGIRSLLILGYGNRFHKHASAVEPPAFEKYTEFVARELAGVVDHFEIWNEPNGYGKLTPELYPAILGSSRSSVEPR